MRFRFQQISFFFRKIPQNYYNFRDLYIKVVEKGERKRNFCITKSLKKLNLAHTKIYLRDYFYPGKSLFQREKKRLKFTSRHAYFSFKQIIS